MSSATSTDKVRLKPDTTDTQITVASGSSRTRRLQPWQFFVLAGLGCATAVTFHGARPGLTVGRPARRR